MGYTTKFTGELKFTTKLSQAHLITLGTYFGEDCKDHPEWDTKGTYIDLIFNKDLSGIKWDSRTEKNDGMVDHINLIIREMRKILPEFNLTGVMFAQGEDITDTWSIRIVDGLAVKVKRGEYYQIVCPHCNEPFYAAG